MPIEFRRKIYKRGSSFETTIPRPLLFKIDPKKKHEIIFSYDTKSDKWNITIDESKK